MIELVAYVVTDLEKFSIEKNFFLDIYTLSKERKKERKKIPKSARFVSFLIFIILAETKIGVK